MSLIINTLTVTPWKQKPYYNRKCKNFRHLIGKEAEKRNLAAPLTGKRWSKAASRNRRISPELLLRWLFFQPFTHDGVDPRLPPLARSAQTLKHINVHTQRNHLLYGSFVRRTPSTNFDFNNFWHGEPPFFTVIKVYDAVNCAAIHSSQRYLPLRFTRKNDFVNIYNTVIVTKLCLFCHIKKLHCYCCKPPLARKPKNRENEWSYPFIKVATSSPRRYHPAPSGHPSKEGNNPALNSPPLEGWRVAPGWCGGREATGWFLSASYFTKIGNPGWICGLISLRGLNPLCKMP